MAARVLPLSSSQCCYPCRSLAPSSKPLALKSSRVAARVIEVRAKAEAQNADEGGKQKSGNRSFFSSIMEALDFSQARSDQDAVLIEEAKEATKSGGKMSREQYGALRRKIGGTYKDFFKSYVDVEGEFVEDGWVDKTCKVCKRDTRGEPRQVDRLGRYVHVACLENSKSGNFFSNLFPR
ncbi:hypothetical protein AXF42_Ash016679 [Apostasia shenzhenica]|uniref:Uncharacterized protein n=1 Tax=Apostasia shenzhenica TaxID=1088818 RepID=A0A2I0APZ5_9ASPA|nr:hypothetical protein AXF42_Ash016679 [Apostasia shenzhenica]